MNNSPLVSVIIPTFNRSYVIAKAINSVLNQQYKNIELIVIDDGSVDQTNELMRSDFSNIHYIKTDNNGVSAARNLGVTHANGKYIAFLDSDDEWMPKKVEKQVDFLESGNLRWVHGEERWIRNGVRVNQKKIHQKAGGDIFNRSLHLCLISPSTVMMEKKLFIESGGFDEGFIVCEDFDLWLRLLINHEIGFISDELICKYGGHEDQLSAKFKAMDEYRIMAYEKLVQMKQLGPTRLNELKKVALRKCDILIVGYTKHGHIEKADNIKMKKDWFLKNLSSDAGIE